MIDDRDTASILPSLPEQIPAPTPSYRVPPHDPLLRPLESAISRVESAISRVYPLDKTDSRQLGGAQNPHAQFQQIDPAFYAAPQSLEAIFSNAAVQGNRNWRSTETAIWQLGSVQN